MNMYRAQTYNSIIRGYFCIEFIDFMIECKSCFFLKNMKK